MSRLLLLFIFVSTLCLSQESNLIAFTLDDLNGQPTSLNNFLKNGPVYLSFWALWCEPCKSELRALESLYEKYKDKGITILTINVDTPKSSAKVKAYIASKKFCFPVLRDSDTKVFEKLNGKNLPYSLLINSKGQIIKTRTRYLPGDKADIEKDLLDILSTNNSN